MKKYLFVCFLFLCTFQLHAADYYWVNGGGNWSDLNHWRLGSSTGDIPSIVPAAGDNVIFGADAGFTAASRTVTVNGNAFCNNMTWTDDVPNAPIIIQPNTYSTKIYGSVYLNPTVTYTLYAEMLGSVAATINANGPIKGAIVFTMNKPGSGVTLLDDLFNNNGRINFWAGYLDASNRNVNINSFISATNENRNLDISNGNVTTANWTYTGNAKTLQATGSFLVTSALAIDNSQYPEIEAGSTTKSFFSVAYCQIEKLTFTATALSSGAIIHSGNTIELLTFNGAGAIVGNNNTIQELVIAGGGHIEGNNNVIGSVEISRDANVFGSGNNITSMEVKGGKTAIAAGVTPNTFGTFLTAPNKGVSLSGTTNITTLFRAGGAPCESFTEIIGANNATLNFGSTGTADIDNVLLANVTALGDITPLPVNGIDEGGNTGFIITEGTGAGATLYWVGGAGDWGDKSHWSASSGGAGGACIPFKDDDVVFDANSGFTSSSKTITTTANTYFKNMTWASGVLNSPVFNESSAFIMRAYGSVVLEASVTMNADIQYLGSNAATLQVNGNTLGTLVHSVVKTDAGGLTLVDDWSNSTGTFSLVSGSLNLENRTLAINTFVSGNRQNRVLNIQNATIHVSNNWYYDGSNKQIQSAGSFIQSDYQITVDGLSYPKIHLTSNLPNVKLFSISNTTIAELRFTGNVLGNTAPRIGSGNTVDLLEFNGGGVIGANNTIGFAEFKGAGIIVGSGNILGTLLTAPNQNYFFGGTTTITDKFRAVNPSCTGLGEIRGYNNGVGTIAFGANAEVEMTSVYLENMIATGGGGSLQLPIAFSGADAGGNQGWTISSGTGSARYWIGGGGDWNDANHWSETSGGLGGACIPTVSDDVYFDQNSGFGTTVATRAITVNNGNAYFHNMSWAGALNSPVLSKSSTWAMESWGNSLVLNPTVTLNILPLQLKGSEATILTGQTLGSFDLAIKKPGGSLTIANDYRNKATHFNLYEGSFIAIGRTLDIANIDNNSSVATMSINIEGSTINGAWRFNGAPANHTLFADNSVINADAGFFAEGFAYNIVNVSSGVSNNVTFSNTTINELTFTNPSVTSSTGINGNNNKLGSVEYKGSGIIHGNGNEIETLIFFPGNNYTITSGTNNTITGDWYGSGTPCKPTEIKSSGAPVATLTKTSGKVDFDYIRLKGIAATGGATFNAGAHTTDMGGNSGWDIAPYDGASPIVGLGPDIGLKNSELPYTIKTDGFFGSPLSQYVWSKDGNTIGSGDQLVVTEPGTYRVDVTFPDACAISDDITISLVSADLSIVKTVDNSTPAVGDNVVFTLVAHNDGPGAGTEVTVTDKLPTGYTYVSDTAPTGTTYDAGTGLWTIGNLALDADLTLTITAQVNASGSYLNEATITGTSDDPDPDNNSSSVALVPSSALIITQPSCEIETGTIEVPEVTGGTYSIDGGITFLAGNIFADLEPGDYSIVVKVGANNSAAVLVTINEAPITPDAPVSGGNQSVCLTNPIQTLTATATVPAGSTITWYDASSGGSVVASPVLNVIGTVVYYAETNNGVCTSKSRTAVVLSINEVPEITQLADQEVCVQYILPPITGTNLTGNEAYYTEQNGGGTKYLAGTVLKTVGTQTLYIYDQKETNETCAGNINVTNNTSFSDNVFIHQYVSPSHHYYPRPVNSDFWKGTVSQIIDFNTSEGSVVYLSLVGDLNIDGDPACTGDQVEIVVGATFRNDGPARGAGYSGRIEIMNKLTGETIYLKNIQADFRVGVSQNNTITTLVPAADLLAGNLTVILSAETAQNGYKSWTISDFKATYKYLSELSCPAEESFQLTINPLPDAPISGGDQVVCATNPIQVLTATATVPAGTTITWYDAATGGNVVPLPILNTVGSVTYYAEAESNSCTSETRTPVQLILNETPEIDPILDKSSCGPFTLPAITGTNLSGNQAYYTEINQGGTQYQPGDVISTLGETTLYAYDEGQGVGSTGARLGLKKDADYYVNGKFQMLFPATHGLVELNNWDAPSETNMILFAAAPATHSVFIGKATPDHVLDNVGEEVLLTFSVRLITSANITGNVGSIALINTATNTLLYEEPFSDPARQKAFTVRVAGVVPIADINAGNISVVVSLARGGNLWRAGGLTLSYQSLGQACPAQQSFKVTINEIPDAPISGGDQEVCASSPIQTLTATAKAAAGSTVKWYDALVDGTEVSNPTLNTVGTVTFYAEAYNGSCVSETRTAVTLTINESPTLSIHSPAVVCHPGFVDLTATAITNGSTAGLDFTYFKDAKATIPLINPNAVAESGTYYIKGTNLVTGCSAIEPVIVQFVDKPEVIAVHPDCVSGTGSISIDSPLGADFKYSLNGGAYSSNPVFENLAPGTYEIRASNSAVPGCESDVTTVVINSTPTTAMPLVIQPDCDQPLGTIVFPVNAAYEYSINDGVLYTGANEFTDLAPGTYLVRSKKAGDACIADAVEVIIIASESRPAQPVSLGDIQVCETNGAQTITAEVTPQAGVTIVWYDGLTGGNIVSSPTLSIVGSVTYYAEASNGTCTSANRTAVTLTITPLPIIYPIANINSCGAITLPVIKGVGLSADAAYYTQSNKGGIKYNAGDVYNELGETTLFVYGTSNSGCFVEQTFKIFIQKVTEGAIGVDQTICKNTVPLPLGSITNGTGSNIKYRWEKSTTSASTGFTVISGIVSATYAPFIPLNTTTYFRRIAVSTLNGVICESAPTEVVKITVQDVVTAGSISADQTICQGSIPAPLTSVSTGTGSGIMSYRWESSTTDALTGFTIIPDAIASNYSPGALTETTYFRRIAISTENGTTCESAPAPAIKVIVQDVITEGAISGDQTICNGSIPSPLTSVSTGTGSGTISYRWESSITDALTGFTNIPGAIGADYSSGALTETTYYRRITISTENGVACESVPTIPVLIKVIGELFAYAGDDQLKYNSPFFTLTADIPTLGAGKWTIVSGTLDEDLVDDTNSQAIVKLRSNSTVTLRWTVSEMVCSVYDDVTLTYIAEADLVTVKSLKDPTQTAFVPGEEVVYTITVTNDGPSDAQNVNIKDSAPIGTTISGWTAAVTSGMVTLPNTNGVGNLDETIATLPNGAKVSYEVIVKTPSDFNSDLVNIVSVTSSTVDPEPACAACETVPLTPEISSQLELWKTGTYHDLNSDGKVNVGDVVNYSFIVRNMGNVRIDGIRIHDPKVPVIGGPISLAAGASDQTAFSAVYTITQADIDKGSIYNLATATGKDLFGNDITVGSKDPDPLDPNDPATIILLDTTSGMVLVKTVVNTGAGEDGSFLLGDEIRYRFVVTNTGNTTLNDILLDDPLIGGAPIGLPGNLLPGVSIAHTASYTVTPADADKGHVLNQATVTAKDPKGSMLKAISGTAQGNNDPTRTPISNVPPISDVPPRADDDRSETEPGKTVTIRVHDNDRAGGADIDPSSIEIVDRPLHGTLVVNPDGTVNYTPDAGYVGDDTFTYRVRDINGNWSNVAKVTITIKANDFFIPNVFTPNGDGRNDTFSILGIEGYDNAEVTIFNRWGNEVYRNRNYKNNWDGNGLNEATYYYLIVLKKEGKESVHKGWVLLKR